MENTIVLKGTEEVVKIVELEECNPIVAKAIEYLNEHYELEELVKGNVIEVEQISDTMIEINGHEYYIFEGKEQAIDKAIEIQEEILDLELWEIQRYLEQGRGIDKYSENVLETVLGNEFVKMYAFKDFWEKENYLKAWENTEIEEIATEEQLKDIELGLTTERYIREDYEKMLNFEVSGRWLEEYINEFGERMTMEKIIKDELIDIPKLARYYVTSRSSLASYLAHYDDVEIIHNNIYMYRVS